MASTNQLSERKARSEGDGDGDATVKEVLTALDQIGSEWRLRVLAALHEEELRFNELKRATEASSSTLSRVLDDLEDIDMVERRVETKPIATYYSLSEKGAALCPVWDEMSAWSAEWVACETIEEAGE